MAQTVCRFYILSDLSKIKIWEISSEKKDDFFPLFLKDTLVEYMEIFRFK